MGENDDSVADSERSWFTKASWLGFGILWGYGTLLLLCGFALALLRSCGVTLVMASPWGDGMNVVMLPFCLWWVVIEWTLRCGPKWEALLSGSSQRLLHLPDFFFLAGACTRQLHSLTSGEYDLDVTATFFIWNCWTCISENCTCHYWGFDNTLIHCTALVSGAGVLSALPRLWVVH